jgi:hypothetical protein
MNNKFSLVLGTILIGGAFYGGMIFGKNQPVSSVKNPENNTEQTANKVNPQAQKIQTNIGNTYGVIVSSTTSTVTIKLNDGTTKSVLFDSFTQIRSTIEVGSQELNIGKAVVVGGRTNEDGSISALNIELKTAPPLIPLPGQPVRQPAQ